MYVVGSELVISGHLNNDCSECLKLKELLIEIHLHVHSFFCSILLASPFWPTLGSLKASTSLAHVGTPVLSTWSTLSNHPASISWRKLGESVMVLSRL